jgi:osmotically-inducible protein OsmY
MLFPRWFSQTSCWLMLVALLALTASAHAQVPGQNNGRVSPRVIAPQAIEVGVALELYGHPDTAHRRIEVRLVNDRVDLSGTVAAESEMLTAERLAMFAVPDRSVVNRIQVEREGQFLRVDGPSKGSPADLRRRFMDVLTTKFPPELLKELTLTTYHVSDPAAWVVVVEGTVPTMRDQLAVSEALLLGTPAAAAVINRTHVVSGSIAVARSDVSVRGPFGFFGVDVNRRGGVAVDLGPLAIRAGRGNRVVAEATDDPLMLDQYLTAVRSDADLRSAQFQPRVLSGVLTLEGRLKPADKMRAVALAQTINGVRGVVDRTEVQEGQPAFYRESDLTAYLRYRLGEHAAARDIELLPAPYERSKLQVTFPTSFHAAL